MLLLAKKWIEFLINSTSLLVNLLKSCKISSRNELNLFSSAGFNMIPVGTFSASQISKNIKT